MATLTSEDLAILKSPFAPDDHEFLKGMAYITEAAITDRIESVDPAWTLEQINLTTRPEAGTGRPLTICTVRLTIKGTWRDGVGMADVTLTKAGNAEANEAEKAAATDAMKRAARLFGIGRYLLNLPENVRDPVSMKAYLQRGQKPVSSVGNSTPAPTTQQPAQNANLTPSSPFGKRSQFKVTGFEVNLSKSNKPYLVFIVGDNNEPAYLWTRQPFEGKEWDVTNWKTVGYHELVPPALITCEKNDDGKWQVKDAAAVDPFEEIGKASGQ